MSSQEQFERAREDETYRQPFLEGINLEYASRFVKRVIYKPEPFSREFNGKKRNSMMGCLPGHIIILGLPVKLPHTRSEILVFPLAFETLPTFRHFQNALIDHEGFHALQNFVNPWQNRPKLEQEAYWNQMTQSYYRGLNDEWRSGIARLSSEYS